MINIWKSSLILLLTFLLLGNAYAAGDEKDKDTVMLYFNGRSWNNLERLDPTLAPAMKTFLVRGVYEGAFAMDPENALQQFYPNTTYTELVSRLDLFYSDNKNLKTPISYALMMISKDLAKKKPGEKKLVSLENVPA
jgi:hypothetical protein